MWLVFPRHQLKQRQQFVKEMVEVNVYRTQVGEDGKEALGKMAATNVCYLCSVVLHLPIEGVIDTKRELFEKVGGG